MTIPIIKHGNLILYNTVYSSKPAKIVCVFSKSTALYTCQKLTKHFQPELFDNSVENKNQGNHTLPSLSCKTSPVEKPTALSC